MPMGSNWMFNINAGRVSSHVLSLSKTGCAWHPQGKLSGLEPAQRLRMMTQVVINETGDKEVAVVVTRLQTQG